MKAKLVAPKFSKQEMKCLRWSFVIFEIVSMGIIPLIPFYYEPENRKMILVVLFTCLWILLCLWDPNSQWNIVGKCRKFGWI